MLHFTLLFMNDSLNRILFLFTKCFFLLPKDSSFQNLFNLLIFFCNTVHIIFLLYIGFFKAVQHERGPRRKDKLTSRIKRPNEKKATQGNSDSGNEANKRTVKIERSRCPLTAPLTPLRPPFNAVTECCMICRSRSSEQLMATMSWIDNQPAIQALARDDRVSIVIILSIGTDRTDQTV